MPSRPPQPAQSIGNSPPSAIGRATESTRRSALPDDEDALWGPTPPDPLAAKQLDRLRHLTSELAESLSVVDRRETFSGLVGASDLQARPVHRWFAYKEGFSPELPSTVLDHLGAGDGLVAADFFGGVATSALALRLDPRVREVRSLEYSPLAHAIGAAKLAWPELDPSALRKHLHKLLDYRINRRVPPPSLSAFSDPRIFEPQAVASLQSARNAVGEAIALTPAERAFFLVGVAAVIEDASSAMKDGRALRIRGDRRRRPTALVPRGSPQTKRRDRVKRLLEAHWLAMIEDLEGLADLRELATRVDAWHLRGDARKLRAARLPDARQAFPPDCVDVALYSPPYLNFIDYTEVYKLELWLLGYVGSQSAFRRLRLGTLRSHPSVRFGERRAPKPDEHPVLDLVHRLAGWLTEYGSRPEAGPIVRQYFEDMFTVFKEQHRALKSGAWTVCVVANSTFSRREKRDGAVSELWRLPVLTDIVLGHLVRLAGFEDVELWRARDLRPRNVRVGAARESLVVARKR